MAVSALAAAAAALTEIKPRIWDLTETKRRGRRGDDPHLSPAQRVIERAKARRKHQTSGD